MPQITIKHKRIVAGAIAVFLWGYCIIPIVAMTAEYAFRNNPLLLGNNISNFVFETPCWLWWPTMLALHDSVPLGMGVFVFALGIALFVLYLQPELFGRFTAVFGPKGEKDNSYGSAHVDITPAELKKTTATWKPGEDIPYGNKGGGLVYGTGKDKRMFVASGSGHNFIWGPPGTGKTRRLLFPSLAYMASAGDHIICTDPKAELFSGSRHMLDRLGYEVLTFSTRNADNSLQYNPLALITWRYREIRSQADKMIEDAMRAFAQSQDDGEDFETAKLACRNAVAKADLIYSRADEQAEKLSMDLSECILAVKPDAPGAFWDTSARNYICAVIIFIATYSHDIYERQYRAQATRARLEGNIKSAEAYEEIIKRLPPELPDSQRNMANVYQFIAHNSAASAKEIFSALPATHPVRMQFAQLSVSTGVTEMNIISSSINAIRQNITTEFLEISGGSDFDIREFGRAGKKLALFIITDDTKETANVPAIMLINQLYQTACATADELGGTCEVRIQMVIEETANLGIAIPRLANAMAMCRSRDIWWTLVIQDLALLEKLYGKGSGEELMAPVNNICFLATNNSSTAKEISERIGAATIRVASSSRSAGIESFLGRTTHTESLTQRQWADLSEVMKFNAKRNGLLVFRKDSDIENDKTTLVNPAIYPFPDLSKTPAEKLLQIGSKAHAALLMTEAHAIDYSQGRHRQTVWAGIDAANLGKVINARAEYDPFTSSCDVMAAVDAYEQSLNHENDNLILEISEAVGLVKATEQDYANAQKAIEDMPSRCAEIKSEAQEEEVRKDVLDAAKPAVKKDMEDKPPKLSVGKRNRLVNAQMKTARAYVQRTLKEMADEYKAAEARGEGTFDKEEFARIRERELDKWRVIITNEIYKNPDFVLGEPGRLKYQTSFKRCFVKREEDVNSTVDSFTADAVKRLSEPVEEMKEAMNEIKGEQISEREQAVLETLEESDAPTNDCCDNAEELEVEVVVEPTWLDEVFEIRWSEIDLSAVSGSSSPVR